MLIEPPGCPVAEIEPDGPLAGRSFCVTGTLGEPRARIHELIRSQGGEVHTAVKKGTTFLVTGADVGRTKIDKALALGCRIIDEAALGRLLAGEEI